MVIGIIEFMDYGMYNNREQRKEIYKGEKTAMKTICGIDCSGCGRKESCRGCFESNGRPFGGECVTAECFKAGGQEYFDNYKTQMIDDFNALGVPGMPEVKELVPLCGSYVNLEYLLPSGQKAKLLDDNKIYLGYQLEKQNGERCYGIVADSGYLLVCEYGCNGSDPEIVVFKKRM